MVPGWWWLQACGVRHCALPAQRAAASGLSRCSAGDRPAASSQCLLTVDSGGSGEAFTHTAVVPPGGVQQ